MIRPVALAIVLALVGCQSADVQRAQPTLTIPAAWRADVGPASPVEGVWWRNFHDSTLNQYVDQALRYNSDVRRKKTKKEQRKKAKKKQR